jgi:hypothetical protein
MRRKWIMPIAAWACLTQLEPLIGQAPEVWSGSGIPSTHPRLVQMVFVRPT